MTPRIYSGADARALRERLADDTTSHTRTVTLTSAECAALDAVPHLAASVEHHEARAERAEAALLSLARGVWSAIGRSGDVTAGRDPAQFAAIVATDARLAVDDLACARDHAATRAERAEAEVERLRADLRAEVAAAASADDASRAVVAQGVERMEALRAERDALRALGNGVTREPTASEQAAVDAAGGTILTTMLRVWWHRGPDGSVRPWPTTETPDAR